MFSMTLRANAQIDPSQDLRAFNARYLVLNRFAHL